jgi:hypothetical protein
MPLNISDVAQNGINDTLTNALLDNNIAAAFGLNSKSDNLLEFYNRFGTSSVFLPDKKSFIIRTLNYFSVSFKFLPSTSKVSNLFSQSLLNKTPDDLKYFIQEVTLPNIKAPSDAQTGGTGFMQGSFAGHIVQPDQRIFDINFLATEFSLHDHCFYYWLKETVSNNWIYIDNLAMDQCRPYTKADIIITFTSMKSNELLHSIVLTECFPYQIETPKVNQKMEGDPTRKVSFAFNNIYVSSTFTGADWKSKLQSNVIENIFNSYIGNKISNKISQIESKAANAVSNSPAGAVLNRQ